MAERLIARACERFQKEISSEQVDLIQSTSKLEDVRDAVRKIERHLAATQRLRNFGRILPFLDSLEKYSKALEVACNGTDYLPLDLGTHQAVQEHVHALDKVLMAYADIGSCMPRLSIYIEAFPTNQAFQHLIAFLFEDIIEFHRKAYSWITKPGFSMFFTSLFGRFDDRFGMLLASISRTSEQIDREAVALDIQEAVESRKKRAAEYLERGNQKQFQQEHSIRHWLELTDTDGEMRLDWLLNRHLEGTSDWILSNRKIRDWLQRGRGGLVLWINGKPGSEMRLVIDGIDEVAPSEHRNLFRDLLQLTKSSPTLNVLLVSQDIPTIARQLSKQKELKMNEERKSIDKDLGLIVKDSLEDIVQMYGNQITEEDVQKLQTKILEKANGMYLWVHLILDLVGNASSLRDLQQQVNELPLDLERSVHDYPLTERRQLLMSGRYARILNNVKSRCSMNDFSKIRRLFAWLICNRDKQPLSRPVARLGMVLEPGCTIINRETNAFVNATDICKAFIEEGPDSIRYLLDPDSGPFLSRLDYLLSPTTLGNRLEIDVAKGSYALLPYANQNWATHLRACVDSQNEIHPDLTSQIDAFSESVSLLEQNSDETTLADPRKTIEGDAMLARNLSPKALKLVTRYAREPEEGTDYGLLHPLLSRATERYHELLRSLVVKKDLQGLETSDFLKFQEEFRSTAFMCLSIGCEKAVSGFSCQADLDNHESRHSQPFRCVDGCAFNDVGFTTIQQLRSHNRKRHSASVEAAVPKRFKKRSEETTRDTDAQDVTKQATAATKTPEREIEWFKQIAEEERRTANNEQLEDVVMDSKQHVDMTMTMQSMMWEMNKLGRALFRWYQTTHDENRARMFFRMHARLVRQFSDGKKLATAKEIFTVKPEDLDQCRDLMDGIAKDLMESYPEYVELHDRQL
ncbi:uncharacterized protein PG998_008608 [Apiospora kogelbergensis]|uniref:uncharacterized protein n=1 Tax=Apiospora kogelbergensis TaxID=1337665 RepID=UPI00312D85C0